MILHFPYSHVVNNAIKQDEASYQRVERLFEHPTAEIVTFPILHHLRELTTEKIDSMVQTQDSDYLHMHRTALHDAVRNELDKLGTALIMECQTFSEHSSSKDRSTIGSLPDICIGSDVFHTPIALVFSLIKHLKACGYKVNIDDPFDALTIPLDYYHSDDRVCGMSIHVNEALYTETDSLLKDDIGSWLRGYLEKI